jgi:hypothetical protein
MVLAESLGDENRQAQWDKNGNRRASATISGDYAPYLG